MDIFKEVKERADILRVCDLLGIKLNRSNMCNCMFHREKTPSFSVSREKQIFKCFGCGKSGDCITLVSEVLNISALEAAKFINNNLGLGINISANQKYNFNYVNIYEQKKKAREQYEKWKRETYNNLCDYLHVLEQKYKEKCDKYSLVEQADEFFADEDVLKYCNEIGKIDYYTDLFVYGDEKDLIEIKKTKGKVVNL